MLTSLQQFLSACFGQITEESEQQDDAQQQEADRATDDNAPVQNDSADAGATDTPTPEAAGTTPEVTAETEPEGEADVSAPEPESEEADTENDAAREETPQTPLNTEANTEASPPPADDAPQGNTPPISEVSEATERADIAHAAEKSEPDQDAAERPDETPDNREGKTETAPVESAASDKKDGAAAPENAPEPEDEPEPVPVEVGIIEEIYDFVEMFENSTVSGAAQVSVSETDYSDGIAKPAIFGHPSATESAKIAYTLSLPEAEKNERLFLQFAIGLRDGVAFEDTERPPGGVKFRIEISETEHGKSEKRPDIRFESVATACGWIEANAELTAYAGKEVVLSLITACNITGNSNYAWALWGEPQLRKFKQTRLRKRKRDTEPELSCGVAMLHFADGTTQLKTFRQPTPTAVSTIAELYRDPDAPEAPLRKIGLYAAQPKLEIVNVGQTTAVVAAGEDFEVHCTYRNVGTGPLSSADTARISISGIKLRRGRARQTLKELAPGEEASVFWVARRLPKPTNVPLSVSLICQTAGGEERQKSRGDITVLPSAPRLPAKVVKELYTYTENGSVVFGNKHLRIVFVRAPEKTADTPPENAQKTHSTEQHFEYCLIFAAKGGNYQHVATCPALSEIIYLDRAKNRRTARLAPTGYQLAGNNQGESVVQLSGAHTDNDGVEWCYEMQWTLSENGKRVQTTYRLQTDAERELLAFRGPMLYAGQGRNREKKTAALFPGLEFLENDERSSSTRDAAPPLHNRLVPHPYKITVPVMAVEMQKVVVGIAWNPLDTWDGDNATLSALFASPNWNEHQKNHALGVFLPSVPTWVPENGTEAATPYLLKAARPLSINTEIIVDSNATILDAVAHWNDAYGTPEPVAPPRSDEEQILLSRHGFMETTWDAESRKSRHCVGWAAHNEPGFGTLLWYDYLVTKDEAVKERAVEIANRIITDSGAAGLAARGSCHILRWEFPFYMGHLPAALTQMETDAAAYIAAQEPDGGWRWHPKDAKTAPLGKAGDSVLGTCAAPAHALLKHARITGNQASREAGVKALQFMQQFSVPRGAQMWECPMYQPDILAAAHAIGAYIEAYELTGKKENLKRARYWAETALPFLYHWHPQDRPGMQFASIPVFGTTFYTHPWFGVPVQWNGLVLAYFLQRLATHTADNRWREIAEGITISAMHQQWETDELKGTYPDGFYGFCTEGRGPHLNPEDIMVNVYTLRGLDPGIKTARHGKVHISSGAAVTGLTSKGNGHLRWRLRYAENETSYALIVGYGRTPQTLRTRYRLTAASEEAPEQTQGSDIFAETAVDSTQDLNAADSGWLYSEDKDTLFVKYQHPSDDVQFEIS